jgi:addiction module HigA family antidote
MPMKNPPHPGELVRADCLEPLGLSITDAAKALNISRQALNNLVNKKSSMSPEMAVRLSKVFNGSPEFWMRLQLNYDLAHIQRNASKIVVHKLTKKQRKPVSTTRSAA